MGWALTTCLIIIGAIGTSASAELVAIDDISLIDPVDTSLSSANAEQLLLDPDDLDTLVLGSDPLDTSLPSFNTLHGSGARDKTPLSETPLLESQSTRDGDFLVPIPAIGAGWALLIGVGMYRVGCRVLRVKG